MTSTDDPSAPATLRDPANSTPTGRVSRLAPSPTGALHLGNARTFLVNWALARQRGWRLVMRIEDLDSPRVKDGAERDALDVLAWLGVDYDGTPFVQSQHLDDYWSALVELSRGSSVFRCDLTRREVEAAASAPHLGDHETRYVPELRPTDPAAYQPVSRLANYRLRVDAAAVTVEDRVAGAVVCDPGQEVGDFLLWTKRGVPSYQLAVVIDDVRQHVTDVVRGVDLLPSAARQTLLYRALGAPTPTWWHLPLVIGEDGRRLAKRHGDSRVAHYRDLGIAPTRVVGLLAHWCGLSGPLRELDAATFLRSFDIEALPRTPIVFDAAAEAWLLGGTTRSL
ncbi:MAG: glutamate--tRNA ligase family protein [Planctomycetota bacterium]